jgi:hypothetical protein
MRMRRIAAATLSASLVLIAAYAPARAEPVCIALTAQVADVDNRYGILGVGDINVGDIITGTYVYESTTPSAPNAAPGSYSHTTGPVGITLNAGRLVFRTDPQNVNFFVGIYDGSFSDTYVLLSYNNIFERSVTIDSNTDNIIFWQLDDQTGTALGSSDLPTGPPVLTAWESNDLGIFSRNARFNESFFIGAHVTSVSRLLNNCSPPVQLVFHLRGTGATSNPPTLSLDDNGPTSTTAKYKDSGRVKFVGGNLWKEVGTWVAETGAAQPLIAVHNLPVWLGLRNSDDQGTNFDVRAEVLKNGIPVAWDETYCIRGITRNPKNAKAVLLAFDPSSPVSFTSTDVLSLRILTRIGTDGVGHSCGGHGSGAGLRLYFDSINQDARLRLTATTP